jgi:ubiquinone/menaquinone biosynthesis C-methylase UbiE
MGDLDLNQHITSHYDDKYSNSDFRSVRRIEIPRYPVHRNQAAVLWAGKGDNVLEIGSGSGDVLLTLADRYKRCVGVELSKVRAEESRKVFQNNPNTQIIHGNFESMKMDFPESFFDTIIMSAVIEHLIDPFVVLEKIYNLLKPGGRVLIETPNIAKWTRRVKLLCGFFPSTASLDEGFIQYDKKTPTTLYDEGHFHYFTFRSLKKALLRAHFKRVEYRGYGANMLARVCPQLFSECFVIGVK